MIISDNHRFAFVHIPKCAGTSVRKALQPIDETIGKFDSIADHPEMGRVHFGHLTLADLAAYFPGYYAKVSAFRSFAIVRDPTDRFFSALFQRLREFKGYNQSQITAAVIDSESRVIVQYLSSSPARLDLESVHFNRQSDYVFNNGVQVVDRVFALDRLDDAAAYIEACTGIRLVAEERENRTAEMRVAALKPFVRALRGPYGLFVPLETRNRIRARLIDSGIYGDVKKKQFVKPGGYIEGFLADFYRQDYELFAMSQAA